jgi:hypothetical protein
MKKIKFEFENTTGETLAGLLELPEHLDDIKTFALFAHCFTCGKDIAAASRISRQPRLRASRFYVLTLPAWVIVVAIFRIPIFRQI